MPDSPPFYIEGSKNVRCRYCGCLTNISLNEIFVKCSSCGDYNLYTYFGTIGGKFY